MTCNISLYDICYNSLFLCTYKSLEDEQSSNICYQIQLLQAFNLLKYDDFIISNKIESCYNLLRENAEIKKILSFFLSKQNNLEFFNLFNTFDNIFVFQLLFSYNYFDIFHKCFSKYLNNIRKNPDIQYVFVFKELEEYIFKNDSI
tara:strand:- start:399 stop:836 length:438 start_codon:yes stop_codon:yes gene_type:complete